MINAESKSEILEIEKIAKVKKQQVNVGIRLNPNTDAKTLSQISTGKKENKFGVSEKKFLELTKYIHNSKYMNLKCLSVHIGSQILDTRPYEKMLIVLDKIIKKTNYHFEFIDLGGGMGIDYENNNKKLILKNIHLIVKKFKEKHKTKIIFEPGRSIIGNSGFLITKIIYIKEGHKKNFIILDAAMNDFMRPALYNARHRIIPAIKNKKNPTKLMNLLDQFARVPINFQHSKNFKN